MPLICDVPSAMAAAITDENPARTSGTSTLAPCSLETPLTMAECSGVGVVEAAGLAAEAGGEQLDLGAHLLERRHVDEAVLVHRLVQHRHAVGLGEQHHQRRLPIGHEPGVGVGLHRGGAQAVGAVARMYSSVMSNWAPMRLSVVMAVTRRSWWQPCTRTSPLVTSPATR